MKKVNFDQPFVDFDGNPIEEKGKPVFIKNLIANKIGSASEPDFEKALHRFELAKKIVKSDGEIELSSEEVNFIRENLSGLNILAAGQILEILC